MQERDLLASLTVPRALLIVFLFSVGCGDALASSARVRAAPDLRCPEAEISLYVRQDGGRLFYTAVGCGYAAEYECLWSGKSATRCFHDSPAPVRRIDAGQQGGS